jgi:gamma-glutamylcyclotransferase (GGCT)/AIG2-like uncharacterized protein YtfP
MEHLFAYGTLMCEDIMERVSGCRLSAAPAILRGYRRLSVRGAEYPGIIPHEGSRVEGLVYRHVSDSAWIRLDRFEGEMYARQRVQIELHDGATLLAAAYVVQPHFRGGLEKTEWDFAAFLRSRKSRFQWQD